MMPDAAFQVTEQQFMRLVGSSNHIAQFYVHRFTVPGLQRSAATQAHIDRTTNRSTRFWPTDSTRSSSRGPM